MLACDDAFKSNMPIGARSAKRNVEELSVDTFWILARERESSSRSGNENHPKPNKLWKRPQLRGDGEALTETDTSYPNTLSGQQPKEALWYAAYIASCREKRVAEHLAAREIETFLPLYRSPRKWKNGCRVELERPLFPGYVFFRIDITERVRVLEIPSVLSIVSRGCVPEAIHDDLIDTLRTSLHLRKVEPHPYLVVGEHVTICAGPFAGLSGVVLRNQNNLRVVITVNLIMRSVAVEVNIEDLAPVRFSLTENNSALRNAVAS